MAAWVDLKSHRNLAPLSGARASHLSHRPSQEAACGEMVRVAYSNQPLTIA